MVCNGGIFLFTLMDWHTASWAILLIGSAEVINKKKKSHTIYGFNEFYM